MVQDVQLLKASRIGCVAMGSSIPEERLHIKEGVFLLLVCFTVYFPKWRFLNSLYMIYVRN